MGGHEIGPRARQRRAVALGDRCLGKTRQHEQLAPPPQQLVHLIPRALPEVASRLPDPVLQQLESSASLDTSVNDCFRPVSKFWDRINRP